MSVSIKSFFSPHLLWYLQKAKHNRAVLDFFDKNYGSIVVGFNEKEEMLFYRASDLKRVEGVWDEDDNCKVPFELMGENGDCSKLKNYSKK